MITHEFPTAGPIQIVMKHNAGRVRLTASDTDTTTVQVDGAGEAEYRVDFADGVLTLEAPLSSLTIDLGRGIRLRDQTVDVIVGAPTGSTLDVRAGAAKVDVVGAFGETRIKDGAGDVTIEQTVAPTNVATGAGAIHLGRVEADVKVKIGAGQTSVEELAGSLTAQSGTGGLWVERAESGKIDFHGPTGDVVVGIPVGTPTWTSLRSLTGRVRSSLPPVGEPEEGADHLEIRVETVSGDITLQPA